MPKLLYFNFFWLPFAHFCLRILPHISINQSICLSIYPLLLLLHYVCFSRAYLVYSF
jgi:hypothetical protein